MKNPCLILFFILLSVAGLSQNKSKYKLIVFEGSDWCANCKRLDTNILSNNEFLIPLNQLGVTIEKIDFPQRKKLPKEIVAYNTLIAEKYNFDGTYPYLLLLNTHTSAYKRISYNNNPGKQLLIAIEEEMQKLQ